MEKENPERRSAKKLSIEIHRESHAVCSGRFCRDGGKKKKSGMERKRETNNNSEPTILTRFVLEVNRPSGGLQVQQLC
ncbi:hypothetical protein OUZ56_029503 [Daphnia magna]|uniref:Uncharacterized protein n=1 Tax=Daphnia magna TaxID=35525 RepID=A0ABR0B722_9CRUS|nr:hypothetical protein OUZ56_029503 [Daphnia magna]